MPHFPVMLPAALAVLAAATPGAAGFQEVSAGSGLLGGAPTWGAQIVDIDGDGDPDVVNGHHFLAVSIFTNDGTGSFSGSGIPQVVFDIQDRHGLLWADLDGDGFLDAVCSHGGGAGCGCSDDGNELWRSLGAGLLDPVAGAGGMLDAVGRGRSFSAADIDGDGDLDLHHSKAPLAASLNSLYRNDGGMAFVDVAAAWGVDEALGTVGGLFADHDDDGDPDLLVGGEEFSRPTQLYRNDGSVFVDATVAAFGTLPEIAGADWGDYDNDGDLDLAVCEGQVALYDAFGVDGNEFWFFANHLLGDAGLDVFTMSSLGGNPVALFEWRGAFVPEKIFLGPAGVHPSNPTVLLSDAYVGAPSFVPGVDHGLYVWRDAPGGTWQLHVSAPPGEFGSFSGNVYTTGGVAGTGSSDLEQIAVPPGLPRIWRNESGVFSDVTASLGLATSGNPRGVSWVDFDNDGDLDLHLVNKGTAETRNEPDVLWRNDGSAFAALTGTGWVPGDTQHLGDGGVWADLDRDGDLDLVLQEGTGPSFYSAGAPTLLYRNDGPAGHWLAVRLGETLGGGTSVGAKVTCHVGDVGVHRRVEANSWRGFQEPLEMHFGLGAATVVDSLVVEWPGGSTQVVGPLFADQFLAFAEGQTPTPASEPAPPLPRVGRVFPQPSRGIQELVLSLAAPARFVVTVHDVAGRRVRRLLSDSRSAGPVRIVWDGRDDGGRPVAAGLYFLRGSHPVPFVRKAVRLR